jgi:hypothetical protein
MQELRWIAHIGSIEKGIDLANELYWNITVAQSGQSWLVQSGDSVIFVTDNRNAVDAFLYGLALAYSVMPEHIFEMFREELYQELGEDIVK